MRALNLDAARVWGHVLRAMRTGRQTLCVVFLLSVMLQPAARKPCSRDLIANIRAIENASHQLDLDSRLYTPTIIDYKKCPKSTMTCFAKEVKVLELEWKHIPIRLNNKLETIARRLNQSQLDCPECEVHTENTMEKFLKNLLDVLQAINVEYCPRKKISAET